MVEFVSWVGVALIGLFALLGFLGVVVTSALTVVRGIGARRVARLAPVTELRGEESSPLEPAVRAV
jgi:hypothetical protein